ncbi:MAG: hypothetical protein LQ349_001215 [Xanthoria aureola]|nr:MAG: hypothetical protein LQ349_001215 [Xanthoria aureola]
MATQYDSIASEFNDFRTMPGSLIELHNVEKTLRPFLNGARVLDLACGSGHYSDLFVSWGAAQVVGVDISPGMISNAKARFASDNLTFLVGDCSQPLSVPGGLFDIVFGGYLLNYAPDRASLTNMYRNIATNLKDGGRFFVVMDYPTEDPRGHLEMTQKHRPQLLDYVSLECVGDVEDGISFLLRAERPTRFEFKAYWLKESVYKEAAQQGGLTGDWKWEHPILPEDDSEIWERTADRAGDRAKLERVGYFALVRIDKD